MSNLLASPGIYQEFLYSLQTRYSSIHRATLTYIPSDTLFGDVKGWLLFDHDIVLCVEEHLNFELGVIEGYGYEVSRAQLPSDCAELPNADEYCRAHYPHKTKFYWYDSYPHPNDPSLAHTHPHHKHIPPDIRHHRIPMPDLSFTVPNLPFLIREVDQLLQNESICLYP
jgi:hypothetical protein